MGLLERKTATVSRVYIRPSSVGRTRGLVTWTLPRGIGIADYEASATELRSSVILIGVKTRRRHRVSVTPQERSDFLRLVREWKGDTEFTSSTSAMAMHPAYQSIIGFGEKAIPLLLDELERDPDHWFWALKSITRVDPVPAEEIGKLRRMADAWLAWGREEGYVS